MRTRLPRPGAVELVVGLGLLLGPLAYALTLPLAPAPECIPLAEQPVVPNATHYEPQQPLTVEPEPEPEPVPVQVEAAPEPMPPLAAFLFVSDAGLVLSSEADHAWGTGRLFEPEGEVSHRVAKRADPDAVPSELWAMRGRTYDLYGPDGRVCTARLGELRVVAQYGGWSLAGVLGEEWFERDPEEASKAEIREGLWRRDDLWLVAEIESRDDCEGALWARDAELPPPAILRSSSVPNAASEARLAAFQKSEELAETKRNYLDTYAQLDEEAREYYPTWDSIVAEHGARVESWLDEHGRPRLLWLDFGVDEGCGGYTSSITSLDFVHGDEFIAVPYAGSPDAVFDADFDGQLELLYSGLGTHILDSATLEAAVIVDEDAVCPC